MELIPCFVINQKDKVKRLKDVKQTLKNIGLTNITVVRPKPANDNTRKLLSEFLGSNLSLDDISNSQASHFTTYIDILGNKNVDNMFIFEDDILPLYDNDYIKKELNKVVKYAPKDADMIYLEFCYEECRNFQGNFNRLIHPLCTAAIYYPSLSARLRIINTISIEYNYLAKFRVATDRVLADLIMLNKIKAYSLKPIFTQDVDTYGSDIIGSTKEMRLSCLNKVRGMKEDRIITPGIKEDFTLNKNSDIMILILSLIIVVGTILTVLLCIKTFSRVK